MKFKFKIRCRTHRLYRENK